MLRRAVIALALWLAPPTVQAQVSRDSLGRDLFAGVAYEGGNAQWGKKVLGWAILTDSTLALHECATSDCLYRRHGLYYKPEPRYVIPFGQITQVRSSSEIRDARTMDRLFFGSLAGDRKEELVAVTYEDGTTAEAPVFKVGRNMGPAFTAKLRYRLKKAGILIPDDTPAQALQGAPRPD